MPVAVTGCGNTEEFTEPNDAGHRYRHGTLSAYNAGHCRCVRCRRAFADYRAARRDSTTSGIPTPHGCWPAEPTSRSSRLERAAPAELSYEQLAGFVMSPLASAR